MEHASTEVSAQRIDEDRLQNSTDSANREEQARIQTRPRSDGSLRTANAPESGPKCPYRQQKRASSSQTKGETDRKGGDEGLAGEN